MSRPSRTRDPSRWIAAALMAVTFALYARTVGFEFVNYDDFTYVTRNEYVNNGLTAAGFAWAWTTGHAANWHPLTWLSHMLDASVFGLSPEGHHLVNVLLHVLNTVLLFGFLRKITSRPWPAALAAALFALHPLHVESVAWVSQRKELLATAFGLLSALAYVSWTRTHHPRSYVLTVFAFAAGLLCKPMLLTLPFLFLLMDYWPLERVPRAGGARRRIVEKLPLLLLSAASGVVTLVVQQRGGAVKAIDVVSLGDRVANAVVSYATYLRRAVWPTDLAIPYPHPSLPGGAAWSAWQVGVAAVVLVALSAAVVAARRRRYLPVGWLWFLGTLFPVIGLVQIGGQAMADRYTYLSLIGPFVAVAWLAADAAERRPSWRVPVVAGSVAALVACMWGSWIQIGHWRDSVSLFRNSIRVTTGNALAHNNLGAALFTLGQTDEAIEHYAEAARIRPGYTLAHSNLGDAYSASGETERAVTHYRRAVDLDPDLLDDRFNLANLLASLGRTDAAIAQYHEVLDRDPDRADARINLANALLSLRQPEEAIEHFRQAIRSSPGMPDAHNGLGVALVRTGRPADALGSFAEASRLRPDWPVPLTARAWILATSGEPDPGQAREAIRLAERAAELTGGRDASVLDTLAVAYASAERFDQAVQTARAALSLAPPGLARAIRGRLAGYERGEPYRN